MSGQRAETIALHGGQTTDPTTKARAVPIYQTDVVRVRRHPARRRPVRAEGAGQHLHADHEPDAGTCSSSASPRSRAASPRCATASGQAAVAYSVLNLTRAGDNIVSVSTLYGGTYNLFAHTLPQYGIEVRFADPDDPGAVAQPRRRQDAPRLRRDDRQPEAQRRRHPGLGRRGARAGPAADRRQHRADADPAAASFDHGADVVGALRDEVHRRPRHLDRRRRRRLRQLRLGRARRPLPGLTKPDPSYHGVVWTRGARRRPPTSSACARCCCATPARRSSPFNAFLFLQGLETLPLRMERHSANALAVAQHLEGHDGRHVGELPGPRRARPTTRSPSARSRAASAGWSPSASRAGARPASAFIESLELFSHLANIGDAKSLAIHNATTTHSQLNDEELAAAGVHAGHRAPVGRHRAHRGHHRRPRPGARAGSVTGHGVGLT